MKKLFAVAALALSALAGCGDGGRDPDVKDPPPCNATTCAGCCFNNSCQTGTAASACGKRGNACVTCGSAQVCKADQTCGVDPNSTWRVQPVSAQIASSNNGTSWDGDGSAPDVFVHSQCPGATSSVVTASVETYSPAWSTGGCTAKASQLLADKWLFQLWDEDFSSHDTITPVLGFQFTEADFKAGGVNFSASGGMTSMSVQLQKQP
jgi:hypothetical protein